MGTLTTETVATAERFAALRAEGWDDLVRAAPRPSPFLLHGWLAAWFRHEGGGADLAVQVASRDGRLVAALPVCVTRRRGVRVLSFLGGVHAALADLLLADGEGGETAAALLAGLETTAYDAADLFGLPTGSRLAHALGPRLRTVERVEAPVLDLTAGWPAVYRGKTDSKKRNLHKRRRRQLAEVGALEVVRARTADELDSALTEAFRLHALRWSGRPDGSGFATPSGMSFNREAAQALAELDVPRIVLLRLDGVAIAFHYFLVFERVMYVYRLAFDPGFGRWSPGLVNTLDALEWAGEEDVRRVEYLGGGERYKVELSDRFEPIEQGVGLTRTVRGRAFGTAELARIHARRRLKRSPALHRLYFETLAPARRFVARKAAG